MLVIVIRMSFARQKIRSDSESFYEYIRMSFARQKRFEVIREFFGKQLKCSIV